MRFGTALSERPGCAGCMVMFAKCFDEMIMKLLTQNGSILSIKAAVKAAKENFTKGDSTMKKFLAALMMFTYVSAMADEPIVLKIYAQ